MLWFNNVKLIDMQTLIYGGTIMEILITIFIFIFATFIIYKNFNNSSKGQCNCGSCTTTCPKYKSNTNENNL